MWIATDLLLFGTVLTTDHSTRGTLGAGSEEQKGIAHLSSLLPRKVLVLHGGSVAQKAGPTTIARKGAREEDEMHPRSNPQQQQAAAAG